MDLVYMTQTNYYQIVHEFDCIPPPSLESNFTSMHGLRFSCLLRLWAGFFNAMHNPRVVACIRSLFIRIYSNAWEPRLSACQECWRVGTSQSFAMLVLQLR